MIRFKKVVIILLLFGLLLPYILSATGTSSNSETVLSDIDVCLCCTNAQKESIYSNKDDFDMLFYSIDWILYEESLFMNDYHFRIHQDLESELDFIILLSLIGDGVVYVNADISNSLSDDTKQLSKSIFERYILENVYVDYFGNSNDVGFRGITCCHHVVLVWEGIAMGGWYNPNGYCIRHCSHEMQICVTCRSVWATRARNLSTGCGHLQANCSAHMVCTTPH